MLRLQLGKYRSLVGAVALFLIVFLGVLGVNYRFSVQVAEDLTTLNLAGAQRALSQRIARSVLQLQEQARAGTPSPGTIKELRESVDVFEATLTAFDQGGRTRRLNGEPVTLAATSSEDVRRTVTLARTLWRPLRAELGEVLGPTPPTADQVDAVAMLVTTDAPALFDLVNNLASQVEAEALRNERVLQAVQLAGMLLAVGNFLFIVLRAVAQLRKADREVERSEKETSDILRTVQEGLFLMDTDKRIGAQQSRFLHSIFGKEELTGRGFLDLIRGRIADRTVALASDYIDLLFGERVNEKLVQSLNPLQEVELSVGDQAGGFRSKYLDFRFTRVMADGRTTHLLVTVLDVTARVELARELEATKLQLKDQFGLLANLMRRQPAQLIQIVARVRDGAREVNDVLREQADTAPALRDKIDRVFALAHRLKGDAAGYGIDALEVSLQQFEGLLSELRQRSRLEGADFLPLAVALDGILGLVDQLDAIARTLDATPATAAVAGAPPGAEGAAGAAGSAGSAAPAAVEDLEGRLRTVARRVSDRQGKEVAIEIAGLAGLPADHLGLASDVAVQLLRNAIVHGVEPPAARVAAGKPAQGRVLVDVATDGAGAMTLSVVDDGAGVDLERLRARLVALDWVSPEQAAGLTPKELAANLFRAGFSTSEAADEDSGQGVGLDLVKRRVEAARGRLQLQTAPGKGTRMRIVLPPTPTPSAPPSTHATPSPAVSVATEEATA